MALSKSKIFLAACLAVTAGLGFGFDWRPRSFIVPAIVLVVVFTIFWQSRLCRALAIVGAMFILSALFSWRLVPDDLGEYFGKKTDMVVVIGDDPVPSDKSLQFSAQLLEINGQEKHGRIMVAMPRYPEYQYGEKLVMNGKLEAVSEYNRKMNVAAEIVFPQVKSVEPGHGNIFKKYLYRLKAAMLGVASRILPEPQSGLLGGLLLGTKDFSDELSADFRTTGTAHIIAISGFNVTVVAGLIDVMLRRFGRQVSFYGSLVGIIGLVIITGAQASVVRAGIMGALVLLAQRTGRLYSSINALLLTSCIMLVQNPKLLRFDLGFQLSFAALAGLMFVQPLLDESFPKFPLKEHLFPTIAAEIATTPLLLHSFGNFSFIAVATNLLVLPIIPWAMLIGFLSIIAGFVFPPGGLVLGAASWFVLTYIIKVIQFFARLPGAAVTGVAFPLWAAILYYSLLIAFLKWKPKLSAFSNLSWFRFSSPRS